MTVKALRGHKADSCASWSAPRSKVVRLRLDSVDREEAPSWSFGEASPNDSEGTSVAFTTVAAENLCASDHESPSCAFAHSQVTKGDEGDEFAFVCPFKIRKK